MHVCKYLPTPPHTLPLCPSAVRLVNGSSPYEGRVEVLHDGQWGTACSWSWEDSNAAVVCRMLGLPADRARATYGQHGAGSGDILEYAYCVGNETDLAQCELGKWDNGTYQGCGHSDDVGVYCGPPGEAAGPCAHCPHLLMLIDAGSCHVRGQRHGRAMRTLASYGVVHLHGSLCQVLHGAWFLKPTGKCFIRCRL